MNPAKETCHWLRKRCSAIDYRHVEDLIQKEVAHELLAFEKMLLDAKLKKLAVSPHQ